MKTLLVNAVLLLLYAAGFYCLEMYDVESTRAFTFYGFVMGVITLAVNAGLEGKLKGSE